MFSLPSSDYSPRSTISMTVGVLGGSFNPAHEGHVHISLQAMKRLGLDQVWWLVSPGNPLKDPSTLASFEARYASARDIVRHPRIKVLDLEQKMRTRYSYDTLTQLTQRYPSVRFVWLMGADNLEGFHRWQRWEEIPFVMPMAIFDRVPHAYSALKSKAATRLARWRTSKLAKAPGWVYLFIPPHHAASSEIRKHLENGMF